MADFVEKIFKKKLLVYEHSTKLKSKKKQILLIWSNIVNWLKIYKIYTLQVLVVTFGIFVCFKDIFKKSVLIGFYRFIARYEELTNKPKTRSIHNKQKENVYVTSLISAYISFTAKRSNLFET